IVRRFGITLPILRQEMDAVRGAWRAAAPKEEGRVKNEELKNKPAAPKDEFDFRESPLLKEFNFDIKFRNVEERAQFELTVGKFERVLREDLVSGLAKNALMTWLSLERLRRSLTDEDLYYGRMKERRDDETQAQRMANDYNDAIEKILNLCPWASQIAGKFAL